MNPQDVFYVGKYVQILYSSINNSKICPKLTKPTDWMGSGGISPLHPYYSRDYRSTSHIKAKLAKVRCFFQRYRCVFSTGSQVPGGFFKFMKNHDVSPRMDPKKSFINQTL